METVKKVEATLVRVDEIAINHTKKALRGRVELLNNFVEVSEKALKTKFNDNEKANLKDEGIDFVMQWLKPKFKFPDADGAFNLQALGLDVTPIKKYWDTNRQRWKGLQVAIEKGKFTIPDIEDMPEVKRHYHYAKNERQEKAFADAVEVCKSLNGLLDKGLVSGIPTDLCKGFKYVRYGTKTNTYDPKLPSRFFPRELEILRQ